MEQRDGGSRKEKLGASEDSVTGPVSSSNMCWRGRRGGVDPAAWHPEEERHYWRTTRSPAQYIKQTPYLRLRRNISESPRQSENCDQNWRVGSVQSLSLSESSQPHGPQHARLPCPSPSPRVCSNLCLSSWWCRPTISSSIIPFSSCLQSFPASGSFPMSQFFASGGLDVN